MGKETETKRDVFSINKSNIQEHSERKPTLELVLRNYGKNGQEIDISLDSGNYFTIKEWESNQLEEAEREYILIKDKLQKGEYMLHLNEGDIVKLELR